MNQPREDRYTREKKLIRKYREDCDVILSEAKNPLSNHAKVLSREILGILRLCVPQDDNPTVHSNCG